MGKEKQMKNCLMQKWSFSSGLHVQQGRNRTEHNAFLGCKDVEISNSIDLNLELRNTQHEIVNISIQKLNTISVQINVWLLISKGKFTVSRYTKIYESTKMQVYEMY